MIKNVFKFIKMKPVASQYQTVSFRKHAEKLAAEKLAATQ